MPAPRKVVTVRVPAKKKMVVVTKAKAVRKPRAVGTSAYKAKGGSKSGFFGTMGGTAGGMLGTALGGPAGGMIGSTLGKYAGAALSSIFGHGDYEASNSNQIKNNNLVLSNSAQVPQFGTGKVACKFVHREFLGDVFSSATANTFKIDSYPINPGQSKTFPWLSGVVGAKFQQYRINGMVFEFRSMSSDALNSTNTALGSVVMSTDYDSADATFRSKQEMENTEYGVSCKPSSNMMHGIECARFQTPVSELFIRAFAVPEDKDIRLYDLGRFSIASSGCQGTDVNLGELWVAYDIDCFKAIEQVPAYLTPYSQYALTGQSATAPLGTAQPTLLTNVDLPDFNSQQQIGLTFTENKISWPIDTSVGSVYMVDLAVLGAAAAALTPPVVTTGNGMFINVNGFWKSYTAGTTDVMHLWYTIKYEGGATPGALPYLNVADYTWAPAGGILQADLVVSQISGQFGGVFSSQSEITHDDDDTAAPGYISVREDEKKTVTVHRRAVR